MTQLGRVVLALGMTALAMAGTAKAQASGGSGDGAQVLLGEPTSSSRFANVHVGDGGDVPAAERALLGAGSGVRVTLDADDPARGRRGSPEDALLGRR